MDYDLGLIGLGEAVPAAIRGFYDAEDRKYRKMEMEAKLRAQEENQARQRMLDDLELQKNSPERRRESIQFDLQKTGQEAIFDDAGNFTGARYRPDYIALKQRLARNSLANLRKGGVNLTPAEEAVDKAFGKEYADYVAGGGFSKTKTNLDTLRGVADQLENSDSPNVSGPIIDAARNTPLVGGIARALTPAATDVQDRVRSVIMQSLKETLGGQFTQQEGENLVKTAYNPALDEKTNAKRLRAAVEKIERMAQAKADASRYYEDKRTLQGYRGRLPNEFLADGEAGNNQQGRGLVGQNPGLVNRTQGLIQPQAEAAQDPQVSNYAKQYNLTYEQALQLLRSRGYGQ